MTLTPGELVGGKYRIVRLIGDGGMGSVYEARHEVLGVPVALKFLHAELLKRPGLAARFLQEARVSATIQSPHVVRVSDVDTSADGSPYLVMELLSGESLQALMDRRGKLSPPEAVEFAMQVLSGLEAAHAIGVVHRDLKPDNVFLTPSPNGVLVKLIDFGIAKLRASAEFQKGLTTSGSIMGTPEYMAPEQLFAAEHVDHRADLYSLGVMLFELLTGLRPADGDDPQTIVTRVISGHVQRLGSLEPSLPPGLVHVIERAMAADREARFGSAGEMRHALAPYASPGRAPAAVAAPHAFATGLAQPVRPGGVAPTLPPDAPDPGPQKGATQAVSMEALDRALRTQGAWAAGSAPGAYVPPTGAATPEHTRPSRRSSSRWLWGLLWLLVGSAAVAGVVLGVVSYRQRQSFGEDLAPLLEAGAPSTALNPLIDAAQPSDQPNSTAALPTSNPAPRPATPVPRRDLDAGGVTKPVDAGARDAGTGFQLPFPLPSTLPALPSTLPALPSTLPPLPSTLPLPKGLPSTFPPILPSGFPALPGFGSVGARPDGGK